MCSRRKIYGVTVSNCSHVCYEQATRALKSNKRPYTGLLVWGLFTRQDVDHVTLKSER